MGDICDSCQNNVERLHIFQDEVSKARKLFLCNPCKKKYYNKLSSLGFKLKGNYNRKEGNKNAE